jgi:hypothetical protein
VCFQGGGEFFRDRAGACTDSHNCSRIERIGASRRHPPSKAQMLPHNRFLFRRRQTKWLHHARPLRARAHGWVGTVLAGALLVIAPSAVAQSLPPSPSIEFDDSSREVTGYVLYATRKEDGIERRFDLGRPRPGEGGRVRVEVPQLETGTWRLELAAYNDAGESPRAPASPSEIRVSGPARSAAAGAAKQPPAGKAAAAPPKQNSSSGKDRKKGSAIGKLWRVIVGSDNP